MRGMARLAASVILVLAVAWGGLWWYAEGRLHDMLAAYAARLTTADGTSTLNYDNISVGMSPLTASATLNNVRWNLQPAGTNAQSVITLAHVSAWIDAFDPLVMHIGLPDRIDISTSRGAASVTFGATAISYRLEPATLFNRNIYPVTSGTLMFHDIDVLAGGGAMQFLHIDDITVQSSLNAGAGPNQTAMEVTESIDGMALPGWVAEIGRASCRERV